MMVSFMETRITLSYNMSCKIVFILSLLIVESTCDGFSYRLGETLKKATKTIKVQSLLLRYHVLLHVGYSSILCYTYKNYITECSRRCI